MSSSACSLCFDSTRPSTFESRAERNTPPNIRRQAYRKSWQPWGNFRSTTSSLAVACLVEVGAPPKIMMANMKHFGLPEFGRTGKTFNARGSRPPTTLQSTSGRESSVVELQRLLSAFILVWPLMDDRSVCFLQGQRSYSTK